MTTSLIDAIREWFDSYLFQDLAEILQVASEFVCPFTTRWKSCPAENGLTEPALVYSHCD